MNYRLARRCGNCVFWTGTKDAGWGVCRLFSHREISADGHCAGHGKESK